MKSLSIAMAFVSMALLGFTPPESLLTHQKGRIALVIGNDGYRHVPKLRNARSDARAIALGLERAGFRVILKQDLTESEMKEALRTFKAQINGGDEALFYFSGHGVQLGGANFLLPVDVRGDGAEQGCLLDFAPHAVLMERCDTYRRLWHRQTRHFA